MGRICLFFLFGVVVHADHWGLTGGDLQVRHDQRCLCQTMNPGPPRLQRRNVEVFDSDGAVIAGTSFPLVTLFAALTSRSGFWQYGTLQWDEFYRYISAFIVTTTAWMIFQYDLAQQQRRVPCPSEAQIMQPGHYILLSNSK